MDNLFLENLANTFDEVTQSRTLLNLSLKDEKGKLFKVPLAVFHYTGIYVFMDIDNLDEKKFVKSLMDRLYSIQKIINQNAFNFILIGCYQNSSLYFVNTKNNHCEEINDLNAFIHDSFTERIPIYKDKALNDMCNDLEFSSHTKEKIKVDKNGIAYIKKHNRWYIASSEDPEGLFYLTLFGGWLGLHKFKTDKRKGLLYFFTFGLFGFGWLFDILEFLLGIKKDDEGYYYLPLDNIKYKWLMFLIAIPIAFLLIFLYYKIYLFISLIFSKILHEIAMILVG